MVFPSGAGVLKRGRARVCMNSSNQQLDAERMSRAEVPYAVRNSEDGTTLPLMEKTTVKVLGDTFRQQLVVENTSLPKEMRQLIVQLERRQRELDQQRDQA